MTPTLEALGIDRLSAAQRLQLIELIWDSLPAAVAPEDVPEWHLRELAKRRADAEARPREGKPWREVLAGLSGTGTLFLCCGTTLAMALEKLSWVFQVTLKT